MKWIYCKRYRKDIQWQRLNELLRECNEESELHVRIRYDNPDWFKKGAEAALLAPTAINQQKFKMEIKNGNPVISIAGRGPYTKIDLGIVKYHFEVASGYKVK